MEQIECKKTYDATKKNQNSFGRSIRKLLSTVLITGVLVMPATKGNAEVKVGYNALETAAANEAKVRNRLLTGIGIVAKGVDMEYSALNEVTNGTSETYYGRNVISIGKTGSGMSACAVMTVIDGVLDTKGGVRNTSLATMLGSYGFLDVTANRDALEAAIFFGRPIAKSVTLELYLATEALFQGHATYYTELQLNKEILTNLAVFGRMEINDFDKNKTVALGGVALKI